MINYIKISYYTNDNNIQLYNNSIGNYIFIIKYSYRRACTSRSTIINRAKTEKEFSSLVLS